MLLQTVHLTTKIYFSKAFLPVSMSDTPDPWLSIACCTQGSGREANYLKLQAKARIHKSFSNDGKDYYITQEKVYSMVIWLTHADIQNQINLNAMITQYKAIKRIVYIVIYDNISSYIEQLQYVGKNQTFLILKINKATLQQKSKRSLFKFVNSNKWIHLDLCHYDMTQKSDKEQLKLFQIFTENLQIVLPVWQLLWNSNSLCYSVAYSQ